jgi:hypothetical protein
MSAKAKSPGRPAKGHTGRQRKLYCSACGFLCYASASAISSAGLPTCGCGSPMLVANLRDLERIDPDGFQAMIEHLPRKQHTAAMRELGYTAAIERRNAAMEPGSKRRIPQPQCAADGCSRFRKYGERFCAEHADLDDLPF